MEYAVFSRRRFTGSLRGLPYHARLAWDVVLYEAEKLRGKAHLPPIDFATMAGITIPEAREALELYQQPDPDSATEDQDGRRLVPVPGEPHWYTIVAWEAHLKERKAFFNRLRQQRWYAKSKDESEDDLTQPNADCSNLTKEPEVKTGSNLSSPKKETLGSKTSSARAHETMPDDDAERKLIRDVLRITAPKMRKIELRNIDNWRADAKAAGRDAWWICAAFIDANGSLKEAKSPAYATTMLKQRHEDEWDCPNPRQSVEVTLRHFGERADSS